MYVRTREAAIAKQNVHVELVRQREYVGGAQRRLALQRALAADAVRFDRLQQLLRRRSRDDVCQVTWARERERERGAPSQASGPCGSAEPQGPH